MTKMTTKWSKITEWGKVLHINISYRSSLMSLKTLWFAPDPFLGQFSEIFQWFSLDHVKERTWADDWLVTKTNSREGENPKTMHKT